MDDRRQEKRLDRRGAGDVRLCPEGMHELTVVNLSAGGAYCKSDQLIELMTRLDVVVELPDEASGRLLGARAVVVRVEQGSASGIGPPYHLALWFQEMSPSDRALLRRHLGQDGH